MPSLAKVASPYQTSLDYAERQRNYVNQTGQPITSQSLATQQFDGGSDGAGYTQFNPNFTQAPAAPTDTPDAYNLWGAARGYDSAAEAMAQLARARQFDPNATVTEHNQQMGGEGGSQTTYDLSFDQSKLPQLSHGSQSVMDHGGHLQNVGSNDLYNQNAIVMDPHYGPQTDSRNVDTRHADNEGWFRYAPMIVAAIASLGAAAPALAAGNATLGSFSTGMGGALTNGFVNGARALGNGGGIGSLIPAAISLGGSALGAPSWATSAANAGYGLTQGRKPNPIGAGLSLAQIVNSAGPGG